MKQSKNKETLDQANNYGELSEESLQRWCYDPYQISIIFSKHLMNTPEDFYSFAERFFYHDNERDICLDCLDRYYDFKSKLIRKQDVEVLSQHDQIRVRKYFTEKKYRTALLEIFKFNWSVLNAEDIRKNFLKIFKDCLKQKLSVFNSLTFTHIYLLLFNDDSINNYILKSVGSHFSKNSFFIQTDNDDWEFLLNFQEYYSNLVHESEKYKDFNIKGWYKALLFYLSINGTFYDDRIVEILIRLFNDNDNSVSRRFDIYTIVCTLIQRNRGLVYKFEEIFKCMFDYDFFQYVRTNISGETRGITNPAFWQPVYFYINLFPEFCKLGLDKQFYTFFSEFNDEYFKKELYKVILKNAFCITNVKNFVANFPFFEELVLNILKIDDIKKTYLYELNPEFVKVCVLKTYNFMFKVHKYNDSDWDVLYNILTKWHNITNKILKETKFKPTYNIKELAGFFLLLYFDLTYYLDEKNQLKLSALYKALKKNLLNMFLNAPRVFYNELDQEKMIYYNIIKYYFTEEKSYSQIYNFLDETILSQLIDKHCTFCTNFGYHSVYFSDFLVIIGKSRAISVNFYSKIFMMLLTRSMQKEILELLCCLIKKVQLHRRDYMNNFILELGWVKALHDLIIEEDAEELKLILASRQIKFIIDNKLVYSDDKVNSIKFACKFLNIPDVNEYASKPLPNTYNDKELVSDDSQFKKTKLSSLRENETSLYGCKILQRNDSFLNNSNEKSHVFNLNRTSIGKNINYSSSDITITKIFQNDKSVHKVNDYSENSQLFSKEDGKI